MQEVSWLFVKLTVVLMSGLCLGGSIYSYIKKMHRIKTKIKKNNTLYSPARCGASGGKFPAHTSV
jgi:predicted glycosyltransferase involved in capsule biosynthesis